MLLNGSDGQISLRLCEIISDSCFFSNFLSSIRVLYLKIFSVGFALPNCNFLRFDSLCFLGPSELIFCVSSSSVLQLCASLLLGFLRVILSSYLNFLSGSSSSAPWVLIRFRLTILYLFFPFTQKGDLCFLHRKMAIKTIELLKGCSAEEIMEVLATVASDMGDAIDDMEALQVIPLSGAMTNEVFQINWPTKYGDSPRKVLIRLYGEGVEIFFNREEEIRTFECMSKHGQGPRLLGRFSTGRVEEFIHARTLRAADLRDPEISASIAAKMREFHNLHMPGEKKAQLWQRMRNWLIQAKSLCSPKDIKTFDLDNLDEEITMLEKKLSEECQEIGFCHNDLQYGNIMMDEETGSITLIDYEYSSYNPVAYDLANHFCEMVANYHTDTPHVLDYSKYPGLEERQQFVYAYLSSEGKKPSNAEVEQLMNDAEKYTLANHLFWGLWGLISSYVNKIDFDYKEYASQRFQQYQLRKLALLDSPTQDGIVNDFVASMT
ncbi:hypothetical protein L6164_006991 [Bauhinia variegata]|uniref:Uncharacterized protein n=1 Tax=Bauhinia variegata TaxID=167791 RepID=A0ACB9PWN4_BAUVA|nr:hypothetical protein L6164_006991 [Bauhinia variegata]